MLIRLFLFLAVLLGCPPFSFAQEKEPIRIGLLTVDSGSFAFFQSHYTDPAKLAVEAINAQGGVLGRKLELVIQTHSGTPATALIAAQKLAQQEKVLFMFGFNSGAMSAALQQRVDGWNSIFLDSNSSFDDLTTKGCYKNYFRSVSTEQMGVNMLKSVLKESGYKTWQILTSDFATGHSFAAQFKSAVEQGGGSVSNSIFVPLNTPDWGSYIAQLTGKPAEGLAILTVGTDSVTLAKQAKQFGLFARYKIVLSSLFTNDIVLPAQGDGTVGVYTSLSYSPQMPGSKNAEFVKLFQQRYKYAPSFLAGEQWQALELMNAAIEKAGSTDVGAVRKALSDLKTTSIMGEVQMRAADHQLMRPMALVQIQAADQGTAVMKLLKIEPASVLTPPSVLKCEQ